MGTLVFRVVLFFGTNKKPAYSYHVIRIKLILCYNGARGLLALLCAIMKRPN